MSDNWKRIVHYFLTERFNGTNSPAKRGAPYPPFDPYKINEENIPDNMRSKFMEVVKQGEDSENIIYNMYYETQEPFNSHHFQLFTEELERATTYIEDEIKRDNFIDKNIVINCEVIARDGASYGYEQGVLVMEKSEEPDVVIEEIQPTDLSVYYFGFKGGEAGDYFDADFFEVYKDKEGKYHWQEETHSSRDKIFDSKEEAKEDAIRELTPDDGSEFLISEDPDELFDRIYNI